MKKLIIAASILDANYLCLKKQLQQLQEANIDWIHYDVMDGNFVNNLSFGAKILQDITKYFDIFIDCHLMVKVNCNMATYLMPYIEAKASSITMHYEALTPEQIKEFISFCQDNKIKKVLALNPTTPIEVLEPYLEQLDAVLLMSVVPGKGGQKFIMASLDKIKNLKTKIVINNYHCLIQVDGGINNDIAKLCQKQGADVVVVGSYLMQHSHMKQAVKELKNNE
ncbi:MULTISPECIES: ribulose-phosphate 3-epimerase [unclassified Spiroplasma]|uniref:ribulose-phosphate 3-epimerase n=1 Tax=unclassified Spiroplasma TaxID=2637901 RepID=UPI00313D2663